MKYKLLLTTIIISNLILTTYANAESHCDQWCTDGVTCDCTWDDATNTLTINSGSFKTSVYVWDDDGMEIKEYTPPFSNTDYNINVVGDNITWSGSLYNGANYQGAFYNASGNINYSGSGANFDNGAFYGASGNINYSGSGANFGDDAFYGVSGNITYSGDSAHLGDGAFSGASGNITYSGNNAEFNISNWGPFNDASGNVTITGNHIFLGESAFDGFSGNAYLLGENIDLSSAGYTCYECTGSITVSPATLQTMYAMSWSGFNGQIYCTQDPAQCDAVLESMGLGSIKSQPCQNCNKSTKQPKRIYTIDEANAVAKPTGNTVRIKYR